MYGYIQGCNLFPEPLSAEEEKKCLEKLKQGNEEARNILIERNLRLVAHVAKKYGNSNVDQDDLISIGTIGLIKAIDNFDTSLNVKFSTYAVPMIIGEIRRFLRDDGMIHISRQIKDNARKVAIAKEMLIKRNHSEPTLEELKGETGLSGEEILAAIEASSEVESIYKPIGAGSDGSTLVIADQLEDTRKSEEELMNRITVAQLLECLEEKERKLIELRYMEGKTQTESAMILGMNQVAVSRLEKKILLSLRQKL